MKENEKSIHEIQFSNAFCFVPNEVKEVDIGSSPEEAFIHQYHNIAQLQYTGRDHSERMSIPKSFVYPSHP